MPGSSRFELQFDRRRLLADGVPVALGSRAYDLLVALWERRSRVVEKGELLELVWPGLVVEENNLPVQIGQLRKVLGADAIATVPGRGYRLTCELTGVSGPPAPHAAPLDAAPNEPLPQRLAWAPERQVDSAGPIDMRSLAEAVAACRRLVLIDLLMAGRPGTGIGARSAHPSVDLGDARNVLEAARTALELRIAASTARAKPGASHGLPDTPGEPFDTPAGAQPPGNE